MSNIEFKDIRQTRTLSLPSYKGSKIVVYEDYLSYQTPQLDKADNDYEAGLKVLLFLLKSWNFVDGEDKPLPIDKETLGQLPSKDLSFLLQETAKMYTESKKKGKTNLKKSPNLSSKTN